jgi:hypothetical protein
LKVTLFFKGNFPATPSSPCPDKEEEENLPSRRQVMSTKKLKEVTDFDIAEKDTPKRRGRPKKVF